MKPKEEFDLEKFGIHQGKGFGYQWKGRVCMVRCFECGKENYASSVATGICAWCGYSPNKDQDKPKTKETLPGHLY